MYKNWKRLADITFHLFVQQTIICHYESFQDLRNIFHFSLHTSKIPTKPLNVLIYFHIQELNYPNREEKLNLKYLYTKF